MSDLKIKKLISFNKDTVFLNYLTESNSVNPLNVMTFHINRNFENLKPNLTYPYKIEVLNNPKLSKAIENTYYNYVNTVGDNLSNLRVGYMIIGYNVSKEEYKIKPNFWYGETVTATAYNNVNYIFKNPLNNMEKDVDDMKEGHDLIFIIFMGNTLDYLNGNWKYLYNASDMTKRRKIRVETNKPPLQFLEQYGTKLNLNKILTDSIKNRDFDGSSLSFPSAYYITYMSKIDVKLNKNIEEYFIFNKRYNDSGNLKFQSNMDVGDVTVEGEPIFPFTDNYPFSDDEQMELDNGNRIIMGLHSNYQYNIYNQRLVNKPSTITEVNGVEFDVHHLLDIGDVSDGYGNFHFNEGVNISETKKE